MATSKGVIQGYAAQAAVDSAHQVIIATDVVGSGSEQAMLAPMIEQAQPWSDSDTLVTADAGYHSDANVRHLKEHNIPALIADNQMRSRDERFADQDKYKGRPDPLSEKKATGKPKEIKRFGPKDFTFNDDNTATCPAGNLMTSPGASTPLQLVCTTRPTQPKRWIATRANSAASVSRAHSNPMTDGAVRSPGSNPRSKTPPTPASACARRLIHCGAGNSTANALAQWSRCLATSGTTSA